VLICVCAGPTSAFLVEKHSSIGGIPVLVLDEPDGVARRSNEEQLQRGVVEGHVGAGEKVEVSG
jgi:hypothetical protein